MKNVYKKCSTDLENENNAPLWGLFTLMNIISNININFCF